MRTYHVEFEFPDLPGGRMYQSADVQANDIGTAANRALKIVRKKPALRGRQIGRRAKITLIEIKRNSCTEQ